MDTLLQLWHSIVGVAQHGTRTMDTAQLLALAAALGWASGIRLYAVVFVTGLAGWLVPALRDA